MISRRGILKTIVAAVLAPFAKLVVPTEVPYCDCYSKVAGSDAPTFSPENLTLTITDWSRYSRHFEVESGELFTWSSTEALLERIRVYDANGES
jgi:hypothetical protein